MVAVFSAYTNGFAYDEAKAFTDMLFVDTLRGWDSTGVIGVSNRGNVGVMKAALSGPDFIATTDYKNFMDDAVRDGIFLMGHNRAATRGTVNDKNAHPFNIDNKIILMQNGTWNGDHKHVKDTEVDTEALAHIIAEETDIEAALQRVNAAYALIWYNVEEKAVYAIRNSLRPLYTARTDRNTDILASEKSTILFAATRQGMKLKGEPYEIEAGHLCKWQLDASEQTWEFEGKKINHYYKYPAQQQQNFHGRHNFYDCADGAFDLQYPHLERAGWINHGVEIPARVLPPAAHHSSDVHGDPRTQIRTTLTELILKGSFRDWEMPEDVSLDQLADVNMRDQQKPLVVEMVDYLPANNHKNCRIWYMFGYPMTINEDAPKILVYKVISDTSEEEMVEKLTKTPIYHAHIGTGNRQFVMKDKWIVWAYATQLNVIVENESTNESTH